MIRRKKVGERERMRKKRERLNSTGAWNVWTQHTSRWTDRQTRDHPPLVLVRLLVLSSTIESKVLMRKRDGVIRVNEINMHSVINTH